MGLSTGTAYWASDEFTRPSRIRAALEELSLRPRRSLGQNFLADGNIRKLILDTCKLSSRSSAIEIGPGLGAITSGLIQIASHVVAVEKDPALARFLAERFPHAANLQILCGDILHMALSAVLPPRCDLMVSNLPYRVASPIMVRFLEAEEAPPHMVVTIHREAGAKFTASPGGREYGVLSITTALRWDVRAVREISPNCFYPRPEVRSVLLDFHRRSQAPPPRLCARVRELASWIFTQRRKKLGSILRSFPHRRFSWMRYHLDEDALRHTGIAPDLRPERIPPEAWLRLVRYLVG